MLTSTIARLLVPGDIIVMANRAELTVTDVYYDGPVGSKLVVEADALSGASRKLVVTADTRFNIKMGS